MQVACPQCQGRGQVSFRATFPRLAAVVDVLAQKDAATATDLWQRLGGGDRVGITAMNNRREALRRLGLVERTRHGLGWQYRLTTAGREVELPGAPPDLGRGRVVRSERGLWY
jgi:hypothetical protein